jgi:DNA-binding helix-hairpin-helix protein with protein kinase domain
MTRVVVERPGAGPRTVRLGERLGTAGAQGEVRRIVDDPQHVAKILRPPHRRRLDERLDALAAPGLRREAPSLAAWPVARVKSAEDGALIGHTMTHLPPRTHRPLASLLRPDGRAAIGRQADWRWFVTAARNLAVAVTRLNRAGVVIGDLAPANVFVTAGAEVTMIDVDGWQVPASAGRAPLPCPFSRGEYKAPEVLRLPPGGLRRETSDRWALAVVIGEILMVGVHPFAGVAPGSEPPFDEVGNVLSGRCWLLGHPMRMPDRVPDPAALLPGPVRRLAERCFGPGRNDPEARPAAAAWASALDVTGLAGCGRNPRHVYAAGARRCPWCRLAETGTDLFPATRTGGPSRRPRSQEAAP